MYTLILSIHFLYFICIQYTYITHITLKYKDVIFIQFILFIKNHGTNNVKP